MSRAESFTGMDRRAFLARSGAAVSMLSNPAILRGAVPDAPVVACEQGRLRGVIEGGVCVFRGVPYAGPVSGANRRFQAPPPAVAWTGIRDALRLGAPSIQAPGQSFGVDEPAPSEDCLFLNIWTPAADAGRRPVMVYQHGGGFVAGSGGAPWQDGGALAREHDVVVVESNHRLGIMGYLYLGELLGPEFTGNQGLQDLVAALKWVNANIGQFGGDPENVMIFGESGGGGKTACLYAMPSAAPYFSKASIESPIGPGHDGPDDATRTAREVMRRLDVSDPKALLTIPASLLLKAQMGKGPNVAPGTVAHGSHDNGEPTISFWPFIDGHLLPEEPFARAAPAVSASKPLIIGGCKDESVFFYRSDRSVFSLDEGGLKMRLQPLLGTRTDAWIAAFRKSRPLASPSQLFIAITTARPWRAHAVKIAERKAEQHSAPVYSYILDYRSPVLVPGTNFPEGSPHASDISMKFDTVSRFGQASQAKLATARNMSSLWAGFARTGVPIANGCPHWPAYTLDRRATMIVDAHCRVIDDPERRERAFFSAEPDVEDIV